MAGTVPSVYLTATARTAEYFKTVQRGTAPSRFTTEFLENLGFKTRADRQLIPVLKAIRFLDDSNIPTQAYRDYLDEGRGKLVLGRQLLAAYEGVFELDRQAHTRDAANLKGKFKSLANVSDPVANWMALTFKNLCELADIDGARGPAPAASTHQPRKPNRPEHESAGPPAGMPSNPEPPLSSTPVSLSYRIEINLPNTTDVEVYRAIFKALREHLLG